MKALLRYIYGWLPLPPHVKRRMALKILFWVKVHPRLLYDAPHVSATPPNLNWQPRKWVSLKALSGSLAFDACDAPLVTVIIPSYGQVSYTLRCLASLLEYKPRVPFEVIVADDASQDAELHFLRSIPNLRLIENLQNLGFLRNCNHAVSHARGQHFLFLNNDTEVTEGWLEAFLDVFKTRRDAGVVGAKLLFPDGRLQEAGGIVWNDASAWNYGRFDNPDRPPYNYIREVDYVSGAALFIRKELFEALGGFDEYFAPAYYEDTDLCFRTRAAGWKVYYQPFATIVHHEGVSHGTDENVGIKSVQVKNKEKFFQRWKDVLSREHAPSGTRVFRACEQSIRPRKTIVVIDHYVPQPDRDAGSYSIFSFLLALQAAGYAIKFWPHNLYYDPVHTSVLQKLGIEVLYGHEYRGSGFQRWVSEVANDIDAFLLSRPDVAIDFIETIRKFSKARIVYYGHDLHYLRMSRQAQVAKDKKIERASRQMHKLEKQVWSKVDCILYPCPDETNIVRQQMPKALVSWINPYAFHEFGFVDDKPSQRHNLLFVAGFAHPPNVDAALWLVNEVMPLVWAARPDVKLVLAGSHPTAAIQQLAAPRVDVTGWISSADLEARYHRARVTVVPLRFGAGVKLKVIESLRWAVPLVTTPVGVQGLPNLDKIVLVENDPSALAQDILMLMSDDQVWTAQASAQLAYAKEHFTFDALKQQLCAVIDGQPLR